MTKLRSVLQVIALVRKSIPHFADIAEPFSHFELKRSYSAQVAESFSKAEAPPTIRSLRKSLSDSSGHDMLEHTLYFDLSLRGLVARLIQDIGNEMPTIACYSSKQFSAIASGDYSCLLNNVTPLL